MTVKEQIKIETEYRRTQEHERRNRAETDRQIAWYNATFGARWTREDYEQGRVTLERGPGR